MQRQFAPGETDFQRDLEEERGLWQSPILYFGKVLDETNAPVIEARISYTANSLDKATVEVEHTGEAVSDSRGFFRIDGVKGIGLMIQVSHTDYYTDFDNQTGFDKRSVPRKGYFSDTEETAEIFRMHHKGTPVPLILRGGGFHAPCNGAVAIFPLRGTTHADILGELQIQGWSGIRSGDNPYDWKIKLTLPNGGIVESTNLFQFVAPETGYSERVDAQVSGGEMARKQYFLKLPQGYIRFKLQVIMGKDMFVSGDYYYNPDGSRNLEPDQESRAAQ